MSDSTPSKPRSGVYLPTLPEGYGYRVSIVGPEVEVTISGGRDESGPEKQVTFALTKGGTRSSVHPDLNAAAKSAVEGVRTIDRIAREETALVAMREETLSALGTEVTG